MNKKNMNGIVTMASTDPKKKVVVGEDLQKTAEILTGYSDAGDRGVIGGYNGQFPLATASKGGIYLVPATGKYYVCEEDYNGTQISAPTDKFVELSVWKNADRLKNLSVFKLISSNQYYTLFENEIFYLIELGGDIQIMPAEIKKLSDENLKLKSEIVYPIPSSKQKSGGWGASDLVLHLTKSQIIIVNQSTDNPEIKYTVRTTINIPKNV